MPRPACRAILFAASVLLPLSAARAAPCVHIVSNGSVMDNPLYPYVMHGYNYDVVANDNDMPWLRSYASQHNVFQGINMSLDWKDREWDMIKAIIHYTANNMTWTSTSTHSQYEFRARKILGPCQSCTWGCGDVTAAAVGLAQAQGIPARFINGMDDAGNGDYCCEMFSTKYNRWIHLFPKGYNWIEESGIGPLGAREILPFWSQGMIQLVGQTFQAAPAPPLMFMPSSLNQAPIPPNYSERWWTTLFQHLNVTTTTLTNRPPPPTTVTVCDDNFVNQLYNYNPPLAVTPLDDPNLTYPLNNVEASITGSGASILISLKNNMFQFVKYQARLNSGQWGTMEQAGLVGDGSGSHYTWTPAGTVTLSIRGVNLAVVHSPDIVLQSSTPGDLNGDGLMNGKDIPGFINAVLTGGAPAGYCNGADMNGDGIVNLADVTPFVTALIN